MLHAPIIKKIFKNKTDNLDFITGYANLFGYIQDKQHPCTYHRFHLHKKLIEEIEGEDNGCRIHFINCGHGDACLIENRGRYALIDFGAKEGSVLEYLQKTIKGNTIDYAICTHIHQDHMADFENVFKNYNVKNMMFVKNIDEYKRSVAKEIQKIEKFCDADNLIMLEIGSCLKEHSHNFKLGDIEFEFVGPITDSSDLNDNSIVLKATYKGSSILFTGDISKKAEREIMNYCRMNDIDLASNVIKVAHHGSEKSSCQEFLNFVSPEHAVMSCGEVNKYSHPDKATIVRYDELKINTLYTYMADSIDVLINSEGKFETIEYRKGIEVKMDYSPDEDILPILQPDDDASIVAKSTFEMDTVAVIEKAVEEYEYCDEDEDESYLS